MRSELSQSSLTMAFTHSYPPPLFTTGLSANLNRRRALCPVFLFFLLYIFLFSTYFIFVKIYLNKSSTFVTLSYYFICNFIFKLPVLAIDVYKFLFFYILFHTFRKMTISWVRNGLNGIILTNAKRYIAKKILIWNINCQK